MNGNQLIRFQDGSEAFFDLNSSDYDEGSDLLDRAEPLTPEERSAYARLSRALDGFEQSVVYEGY